MIMSIYSDFGVSDGSSKKANELQAAITRQQYDDYQTRFVPYLNQLTAEVSPNQIAADKNEWNNTFMNQANEQGLLSSAMTNRNMSRFGAEYNPRLKKENDVAAKAYSSGSAVSNMNNMNQSIDDRVVALLSGQNLSDQRA